MSSNAKYRSENNLVQSIILFIIFFGLFLGGIFAMSFWSLGSAAHAFIPGGIAFLCVFLALMIPLTFIGRSNSAGE
ncbi:MULTISPECIES: hypothetical protein [unclassified Arthrobacter]|uniref:hypothetical protein n=1 Tax=unclassified Arthrobacter TaxID=235627 RepID=UPI00159D5CC0|nr:MULTISPECIES: hypothetical protein [unclassified Arthrobacter]MCQ9163362.1 hypothetical protein [Arthrobacter sp. STN4]NVM99914.1 hypothetical protein [Arthrobacter sp. SDTb3-6]